MAVQCQFKECVELLLLKGAGPNMINYDGNTDLHYAACGKVSIAKKLLFHDADIEARNKHDLTPLLLAINENNEDMVMFLVRNHADVHAVDREKRYKEIINNYIKEYKKIHPEEYEKKVKEISEDSSSGLSKEYGPDDPWPSDDDIFGSEPKGPPKPNLVKLLQEFQQSKKQDVETTNVISLRERNTEDSHCSSRGEHGSKAIPKGGITIKVGTYHLTNDGSDSHDKGVSETLKGTIKVKEEETELEPKEDKGSLAVSKNPATVTAMDEKQEGNTSRNLVPA